MSKKQTITGILIDSEKKEIREVTFKHSIDAIHSLVKCSCITAAESYLFNPIDHALFVDDEGLLLNEPLGAFQILNGQVLSGNGLIVGIDEEGESIDHNFDLGSFIPMVRFANVLELPEASFEITSF